MIIDAKVSFMGSQPKVEDVVKICFCFSQRKLNFEYNSIIISFVGLYFIKLPNFCPLSLKMSIYCQNVDTFLQNLYVDYF